MQSLWRLLYSLPPSMLHRKKHELAIKRDTYCTYRAALQLRTITKPPKRGRPLHMDCNAWVPVHANIFVLNVMQLTTSSSGLIENCSIHITSSQAITLKGGDQILILEVAYLRAFTLCYAIQKTGSHWLALMTVAYL